MLAVCSGCRVDNLRIQQIADSNLIRRPRHHLLGGQYAVLDQAPNAVIVDFEFGNGFRQGQPQPILVRGMVRADAHAPGKSHRRITAASLVCAGLAAPGLRTRLPLAQVFKDAALGGWATQAFLIAVLYEARKASLQLSKLGHLVAHGGQVGCGNVTSALAIPISVVSE